MTKTWKLNVCNGSSLLPLPTSMILIIITALVTIPSLDALATSNDNIRGDGLTMHLHAKRSLNDLDDALNAHGESDSFGIDESIISEFGDFDGLSQHDHDEQHHIYQQHQTQPHHDDLHSDIFETTHSAYPDGELLQGEVVSVNPKAFQRLDCNLETMSEDGSDAIRTS